MEAKKLFIERCGQLNRLSQSSNEIELLDLSALLRKLLADQKPLVHSVNCNKLKLNYVVTDRKPPWENIPSIKPETVELWMLEEGLDPEAIKKTVPTLSLNHDKFLSHICIYYKGKPITVHNIIKYAANAAGGVHHDPIPKTEFETIAALAQRHSLNGLPVGIRQLRPLARIVYRGLQPLIDDVQLRLNEGRP